MWTSGHLPLMREAAFARLFFQKTCWKNIFVKRKHTVMLY
ncbi:hypothetical protein M493_03210 [Geobacillus genomosp. 3]|uniref:Uncharacterized protein n=1 Tax=Geobacillus genomosp. 3 TaxID=1921421 RepID=S5Z9X1_GEOG3|nr:hypothetical protein M493_03210 [Geobacillus genomosp. 3]